MLVAIGDQHSAYDRTAQLVAHIDALRAAHPHLPIVMLIDGDVFEHGNAIALRSGGAIDFAMLAALAKRVPTILNVGNHEPEFFDLTETLRRVAETGVTVVSDIRNRKTGQPFAPASVVVPFGAQQVVIIGFTTNHLPTFRPEARPDLDIPDPLGWARENLPSQLATAPIRVVLSHAGLPVDRAVLPLVPDGTLFVGAHDHLRLVHRERHTVYVHSGSWNEFVTQVWLRRDPNGAPNWTVEQVPIATSAPADPTLATLIAETEARFAPPADQAEVGRTTHEYTPAEAEQFVVAALRDAAHVDVAFVGHTTFGAGLPAGPVSRLAFDACVRFDGTVFTGEISGTRLKDLLAHANQTVETDWDERRGEYLVAAGPTSVDPHRTYRIAVVDWIAKSPATYLGENPPKLTELPGLRLKAIASAALGPK